MDLEIESVSTYMIANIMIYTLQMSKMCGEKVSKLRQRHTNFIIFGSSGVEQSLPIMHADHSPFYPITA